MNDILNVCSELKLGNNVVDFVGKGNIWINNTYDYSIIDLARTIIYRAIDETALSQLSIVGYDSDLSGIFAPFSLLTSGEMKVMELIDSEKALKAYLEILWHQVQEVQNVIQGRTSSLFEFRRRLDRPIEGYKLVILSLDMGIISNELRAKIAMLMRHGPAYGVSFLIISTTYMSVQSASGEEYPISVKSLAPNITVLGLSEKKLTIEGLNEPLSPCYAPVEGIIKKCETLSEDMKNVQLPVVEFDELHDISFFWNRSSIEGISFTIGKYGVNNMEITIGDEVNQRHNAIITGAVGQGKSNLISMIIHSICLNYSPKEVRLFLLDFKEGVTFKAFSNIDRDDYLPHAEALGLESDISYGQAVLDNLYREYQKRMRLLKTYNLKNIRDLRIQNPEIELPRIVVIIDEFQMMFGDDMQIGQRIVDVLEKSVRLFRAAGIHFILASQTIGGNMALMQKKDNIFSQIPIRIALKNSIIESQQTLGMNNSAAAYLRPREAIVNLDYGEITQNKKTVIGYADENLLEPLRKEWWEQSKSYTNPPHVFENEKRITIKNAINDLNIMRKNNRIPSAILGEKISVNGELVSIPMTAEMGKNIAILGTPDNDCNLAVGMIQSIAVSLAVQYTKGNARFLFCDFKGNGIAYEKQFPVFAKIMENMGFFIETIQPSDFENTFKSLQNDAEYEDDIYVFGAAMDRWEYEKDPYGQGSSLKDFVENMPSKGVHFIGWWIKASNFNTQISGFGGSDAFNTKIFLRIDERAVQSLTNPFVHWMPQENKGLISDAVELNEELMFVPFAPIVQEDVNAFRTKVWN